MIPASDLRGTHSATFFFLDDLGVGAGRGEPKPWKPTAAVLRWLPVLGVRSARGARGVEGCGDGRGVLRVRADALRSTVMRPSFLRPESLMTVTVSGSTSIGGTAGVDAPA